MTVDAPVDLARLQRELALAAADVDLDPPGLAVHHDGDQLVVTVADTGVELRRIPKWRVAEWDPGLMRDHAALQAARLPAFQADQAVAAVNAGDWLARAPADEDWVYVDLCGEPFMKVHRRDVVVGWPPDA